MMCAQGEGASKHEEVSDEQRMGTPEPRANAHKAEEHFLLGRGTLDCEALEEAPGVGWKMLHWVGGTGVPHGLPPPYQVWAATSARTPPASTR